MRTSRHLTGMQVTRNLASLRDAVLATAPRPGRATRLVAISGIDASGKGYTADKLAQTLGEAGARVALIGIDGWLHLPSVRFGCPNPGWHFYNNAFRFEELFAQLLDPLTRDGSADLEADFTEETATAYRKQRYAFRNIDTVLVEGIFLMRTDLRERYDLRIWVESSFETALRRAVRRGQEGLPPAATIEAFESIYFPAQNVHFALDNPRAAADVVFNNESEQPLQCAAD